MDHLPDWFVALFNGFLVIVTYLLVRATGDLRRSTDKLWEAGERQIAIAQMAAEAANASAKIADEGLRTTQRAYIGVEPDGIRPYRRRREGDEGVAPADVTGHFFIKNVGHLPARELSWFVDIVCDESYDWKPPPKSNWGAFVGNMTVTPGMRVRRATRTIRTTDFLLFSGAKSKYCYVWGQVR